MKSEKGKDSCATSDLACKDRETWEALAASTIHLIFPEPTSVQAGIGTWSLELG